MAYRGDSPRRTLYAWILGALIIYALISVIIAGGTADKCGEGAPKEWQWVPPEWECTNPFFG